MITAKTRHGTVRVDFAINRGAWWGKCWIVAIQMGYHSCYVLVESDNESDAIDELADSRRSYLIDDDDPTHDDYQAYAGNDGHPVNLDNVMIYRAASVNYFAKKETV